VSNFIQPGPGDLWELTDLLILLFNVARHMRTHANQMAREHGMTQAQRIILDRLRG